MILTKKVVSVEGVKGSCKIRIITILVNTIFSRLYRTFSTLLHNYNMLYYTLWFLIFFIFLFCNLKVLIPIFWIDFFDYTEHPMWRDVWSDYKICISFGIFSAVVLDCLNLFWYYRIISIVQKNVCNKKEKD